MTRHVHPHFFTRATRIRGNSITFCSCMLDGTKVEQIPMEARERRVMWIKDIAAGAGLVLFMVSAFVLASGAQGLLLHPGI
jgi:hypothetical protein